MPKKALQKLNILLLCSIVLSIIVCIVFFCHTRLFLQRALIERERNLGYSNGNYDALINEKSTGANMIVNSICNIPFRVPSGMGAKEEKNIVEFYYIGSLQQAPSPAIWAECVPIDYVGYLHSKNGDIRALALAILKRDGIPQERVHTIRYLANKIEMEVDDFWPYYSFLYYPEQHEMLRIVAGNKEIFLSDTFNDIVKQADIY